MDSTCERRSVPIFSLNIRNWNLPGAQRFLRVLDNHALLDGMVKDIERCLFSSEFPPPEIRSIAIVITSHSYMGVMKAPAYHSVSDIDSTHHIIEIAESFLAEIVEDRIQDEILGVLLHEIVHCFQSTHVDAPSGLIEGLADWVRLRQGLDPPHWKADTSSTWDAGYDVTAYFLEFLENSHGSGTVARINAMACSGRYCQSAWDDMLNMTVLEAWDAYCLSLSGIQVTNDTK